MARLFRTKPPQQLIDEADDPERRLKKTLTAFDLVAFGLGATIGSGIFALTGTAAAGQAESAMDWWGTPIINFILNSPIGREGAGPALVISFIVAAIACGFAAMCYAELASMIPVSGSAYTFAYASLGELMAWIIGWDLLLEYAVGNTAVAVSWSEYFVQFWYGITRIKLPMWLTTDSATAYARTHPADGAPPDHMLQLYSDTTMPVIFGHDFAMNVPAFVIVMLITWLLVVGIKESASVNTAAVAIKVVVVLFFIFFGMAHINPTNWVPFMPNGIASVMGGAAIVFFSFIGFDAVSSTAEETKNPQRDMPIGMLGSLVLCTLLYCLVSLVLTGILPYKQYLGDAAPVATALNFLNNPWAHILVTAGALAGMTSVLLVFQLGQPRIFMAMSRDGLLPKFFGRIHPKYQTPVVPTVLTGVFVAVTSMFMGIGPAAELTNIGTLAAFIIVCGGVLVLRKTAKNQPRAFKCPLVPLIPILGILSCFVLMLSLPIVTWLRFVGWMAAGTLIYLFYGYRNAGRTQSTKSAP